jgi:hypothetical protein
MGHSSGEEIEMRKSTRWMALGAFGAMAAMSLPAAAHGDEAVAGMLVGGGIGAAVGGPPGAAVGAILGGIIAGDAHHHDRYYRDRYYRDRSSYEPRREYGHYDRDYRAPPAAYYDRRYEPPRYEARYEPRYDPRYDRRYEARYEPRLYRYDARREWRDDPRYYDDRRSYR